MRFIKEDDHFAEPEQEFYCSVGSDGEIIFTSPSTTQFLEYKRESLEGQFFTDLVHPNDTSLVAERLAELQQQVEALEFAARFKSGNGSYWSLDWTFERCGRMYTVVARLANDTAGSSHQSGAEVTSIGSVAAT